MSTAKKKPAKAPEVLSDPVKTPRRVGKRVVITLSIVPEVLARLDAWASARGMSRAAAVAFAVSNLN